jgi:hypothetical protein
MKLEISDEITRTFRVAAIAQPRLILRERAFWHQQQADRGHTKEYASFHRPPMQSLQT